MNREFKPINEFVGDTNKSKLTDTQAYLRVRDPLLFCVKFIGDSEIYLLGEENETQKAVEIPQIALDVFRGKTDRESAL